MASSSHPSTDRGKAVVAARNSDLSGWISDEETRLEFLRWMKFKHIVPDKYLNLDLFEKEGFHFQEWIETQGLSTLVQMKGDWYADLVRVFYNNMRNIYGVLHSRVNGVNVHIDNDVWFQLAGLKAQGLFSHLRLNSIGLVKTTKGWCLKDVENMVQSSRSTPALNEDRTKFKLRKFRADVLGLDSPDLAPALARYELWKAARTKSDGNMTSSSTALISQRICNQQLDSWECGFYVMCWIKTIIRAGITDDWKERFQSTSPIPEDTIRQIRQEWTAYLLQRWS
ncbi:hypothetical protein LR48_Vigan05g107300 [Vigna angularis]|uniref:Ubiquitin-like protease family profile domain-containing protein n=1 Tax=Phaseolus angularis TaxID=3914 RepID=A0A0L9ULQ2_PHAAN|nr:hypothetical protein LR48_Vigan05g107300 [Vigna angularis]